MPSPLRVFIEATVIGILLALLYIFLGKLMGLPSRSFATPMLRAVALSGALFHVLFEVTGLNRWYAKQYVKI